MGWGKRVAGKGVMDAELSDLSGEGAWECMYPNRGVCGAVCVSGPFLAFPPFMISTRLEAPAVHRPPPFFALVLFQHFLRLPFPASSTTPAILRSTPPHTATVPPARRLAHSARRTCRLPIFPDARRRRRRRGRSRLADFYSFSFLFQHRGVPHRPPSSSGTQNVHRHRPALRHARRALHPAPAAPAGPVHRRSGRRRQRRRRRR